MKKPTKTDTYPRLEQRKLSTLKAHPDGVRTHSADTLYVLSKGHDAFGLLRVPFVVNDRTGNLLDGDLFVEVLRAKLNPDDEVPVWVVDLDPELEDAAHLTLQNHAGEWQWEPVSVLLKRLVDAKQDVRLTGFHASDTGPLLAADWKPAAKGPLDGSDAAQEDMFK